METILAPSFELAVWNHSVSALEGLARTNNAVEGWHFGLQSLFQCSHPNIWTLIRQLEKDSRVHKFNWLQGKAGAENPTRLKYRKLNARVQNITRDYQSADKLSFLRAIAHLQ